MAEYTTWARPDARTTHGPAMDMPLLRTTLTGTTPTTQYYHQDGLGSIIALSNASGGTDATARYDAWGNVLASAGSLPRYGYTGREPDETGLIYYRARYYDPTLARFTQRDPIGLQGGLNPYAYVGNDPINGTDPTGELGPAAVGAIYGFWSGAVGGFITGYATGQMKNAVAGAFIGGVAGAAVGAFTPWLSNRVGAVAANFVLQGTASAVGQVASNAWNQQSLTANFSTGAVVGAGVGGALGSVSGSAAERLVVQAFGRPLARGFDGQMGILVGQGVDRASKVVRVIDEGVMTGLYETAGAQAEKWIASLTHEIPLEQPGSPFSTNADG